MKKQSGSKFGEKGIAAFASNSNKIHSLYLVDIQNDRTEEGYERKERRFGGEDKQLNWAVYVFDQKGGNKGKKRNVDQGKVTSNGPREPHHSYIAIQVGVFFFVTLIMPDNRYG